MAAVTGRLGGVLDLLPGGLETRIIPVVAVEPHRRTANGEAQDKRQKRSHMQEVYSLCGILIVLPPMNSRITASPGMMS